VSGSKSRAAPPVREVLEMTCSELTGAIVRMRTRDEYDGMLGKVCGAEDGGEMLVVKHRPINFPRRRNTTVHCFKKDEVEIIRG